MLLVLGRNPYCVLFFNILTWTIDQSIKWGRFHLFSFTFILSPSCTDSFPNLPTSHLWLRILLEVLFMKMITFYYNMAVASYEKFKTFNFTNFHSLYQIMVLYHMSNLFSPFLLLSLPSTFPTRTTLNSSSSSLPTFSLTLTSPPLNFYHS